MRATRCLGLVLVLLFGTVAQAGVLRIVTVEASDAATYLKEVERGKELLKSKGSPATIHVWRGRFAGDDAGRILVSVEYPDLEALAKDDTRMRTDPELRAWLQGLDRVRTVLSDSVYQEMSP